MSATYSSEIPEIGAREQGRLGILLSGRFERSVVLSFSQDSNDLKGQVVSFLSQLPPWMPSACWRDSNIVNEGLTNKRWRISHQT